MNITLETTVLIVMFIIAALILTGFLLGVIPSYFLETNIAMK